MKTYGRILVTLLMMGVLVGGLTAGCSGGEADTAAEVHLAPLSAMPHSVQTAPQSVQQAYQFAVANPDLLQQIPCYCGCGAMGHDSNYACYVQGSDASGQPIFDGHALGCSICVDITLDAMRLTKQGKSTAEIRAFVDQTYARFGPSNIP